MELPQFFRSIRFRIAAWSSLAVAAVAIVALLGLRQSIRWTLTHEVDQALIEDGDEVNLVLRDLAPDGLEAVADELRRKATGHRQHRWFVRLIAADGSLVWQSDIADEGPAVADEASLQTVGEYRLHCLKTPPNKLGVVEAQLGAWLLPLRDDLQRIDRIVVGATVLMLLLAPLCGYWLAGLATRDLAVMTAQAARMRPARLDERLPERGVGDELDRLAHTVNGLLDRIAEFLEEKRTFLANAAHELRTPIAAIRSSAEVTLAADRSNEEYRDLLEQLIEDSESLEVLVNQVLLLSEAVVSEDVSPRTAVPFSDVVSRAVDMFRGVGEVRQIDLQADIEPNLTVLGIRQHLSQVVNNLIDNALKYTPEGGSVSLKLSRLGPDQLCLRVSDTGIGIDEADVPRVFDRFFRADRARQRQGVGGTGLGLSICQSVVEAHHGEIACRSAPGAGSEFEVRLPAQAAENSP
ncbi:MAG: HAMP domain-containing protein [Planctomycetales bacterium]|nr:HAMP domain-containing protein [Planctomycetales bacterium]